MIKKTEKSSEKNMKHYRVLGIMSGTSLDGVDLAFCDFSLHKEQWQYRIESAETVPYPDSWLNRLTSLENKGAREFALTDLEYGAYLGMLCREFLSRNGRSPDFIASHGHTIFHEPSAGLTAQIGKGSSIAAITGIPVISDFRALDVALGGQGAPLVPVGDKLLFGMYDYCLNLGGFGNISFEATGGRIAFDICPVNIVLNHFSRAAGFAFDEGGKMARSGEVHMPMIQVLENLSYYHSAPPKSLGKEWVISEFLPVVGRYELSIQDVLRTLVEHISIQISRVIPDQPKMKVLITGGGAFNEFLIETLRKKTNAQVLLPDALTINYKEALIFAFLGVLRQREEINCLRSVTGASRDAVGGTLSFH
jgi:anhydro-N-acetylmuramic acid kinase